MVDKLIPCKKDHPGKGAARARRLRQFERGLEEKGIPHRALLRDGMKMAATVKIGTPDQREEPLLNRFPARDEWQGGLFSSLFGQ